MYVGVLLILVAESWFFDSVALLRYAGMWFVFFFLFILVIEEPRLRSKYGREYFDYCKAVRRWIPGKPYRGPDWPLAAP